MEQVNPLPPRKGREEKRLGKGFRKSKKGGVATF